MLTGLEHKETINILNVSASAKPIKDSDILLIVLINIYKNEEYNTPYLEKTMK